MLATREEILELALRVFSLEESLELPALRRAERQGSYVIYAAYLEGRRSIRLSYGRVAYIDSKSFIASNNTHFAALTS